jgi:hypothetical protein
VTQLSLGDLELQAEMARAPHWVEPRSKVRTSQAPARSDYRAWLLHADGCVPCDDARDDLVAMRDGSLEWEAAVPCKIGLRLLPLEDVDFACPGIGREEQTEAIRRLIDHARKLDGWGPEARMSAGQAWGREA